MSMPFYGEDFTFTQPDGSEVKVKGWGDQHYAVFETHDGFTVVKDPSTGYYTYASLSDDGEALQPTGIPAGRAAPRDMDFERNLRVLPQAARAHAQAAHRMMGLKRRWEVRRERTRSALRASVRGGPMAAPPQQHTLGNYVGLCLLVQFPEVPGTIAREEVERFCNLQGYSNYGNNGSVHDYFFDNSGGKLQYTNLVTEYYTARNPRSYYTNASVEIGIRTRELIKEALTHLKQTGFDFTQLSADDEGYVYAVNVFYPGDRVNNWMEGLWPHSWSLATPFALTSARQAFDYQITNMGNELTLSTFCHENGHMVCDFPDLYDYGYESSGVGDYCLMVSGGRDRKNPVQICGYLKYKSGWADSVSPISSGMSELLAAGRNDFLIYARNRTEYFLVENRQRNGRDAALPSHGLAIWHVDELGSNNYEHMTEQQHYECALEQADSRFDLEKGINNGDAGDLFTQSNGERFSDTSSPGSAWWDGTNSGLDIHDIGASAPEMSFHATLFGDDGNQQQYSRRSSPDAAIPDNTQGGITDNLHFDESALVSTLKVRVGIRHSYRGDLRVSLTSPSGTEVLLHDRSGGSADDLDVEYSTNNTPGLTAFAGETLQGDWTLTVQDLAPVDTGRFETWQLDVEGIADSSSENSSSVIELNDAPGVRIPDNVATGIERNLNVSTAGDIRDIEIGVDITHSYIGDLVVSLESPAGTVAVLHNRQGEFADNIVRVYTALNSPELAAMIGEATAGTWRLKTVDKAGMDEGKLNSWNLRLTV